MKLDFVWIVRNPTVDSVLADILWRHSMTRIDAVPGVNHCAYLDFTEALEDARQRLRAVAGAHQNPTAAEILHVAGGQR